jgi:hypothetical protein
MAGDPKQADIMLINQPGNIRKMTLHIVLPVAHFLLTWLSA